MSDLTRQQWQSLVNNGWKGELNVHAYALSDHGLPREQARYQSPLSIALENTPELIMPLILAGAPIEANSQFPLMGNLSPLMMAVNYRREEAISWMFEKKVNIHHLSDKQYSVFHNLMSDEAQCNQWLPVLFAQGFDPHIPDPRDVRVMSTCLHSAASYGCARAIHHLLEAYPDLVNATNEAGDTALTLVCASGVPQALAMIDELIAHKADLDIRTGEGENAICAALYGFSEDDTLARIQKLVQAGADVNLGDNNGMTSLMFALYNHPKTALYLLEQGADPFLTNKHGLTFWDICKVDAPELHEEALEFWALKEKGHLNDTLNEPSSPETSKNGRGIRL